VPANSSLERPPISPRGSRLRELRLASGRSQLWVEAEADLGTGYLQRLESGRVAQPDRITVERILDALQARYSERREVLALFGYTASAPLPTSTDLAWARAVSAAELARFPFPAYVLDCTHCLVAWNPPVGPLLGVPASDPTLAGLAGRSVLAAWFDPCSRLGRLVRDPDAFLPALIRALRYEMQAFSTASWYPGVLAEVSRLPRFRQYWDVVEHEEPPSGAARALVPLRLAVPGAGILQFRLSAETFTRDARFRLVYYFPADLATMTWASGAGFGGHDASGGGRDSCFDGATDTAVLEPAAEAG
jgi:transcriptional regulator with XRE-family HTH domain